MSKAVHPPPPVVPLNPGPDAPTSGFCVFCAKSQACKWLSGKLNLGSSVPDLQVRTVTLNPCLVCPPSLSFLCPLPGSFRGPSLIT